MTRAAFIAVLTLLIAAIQPAFAQDSADAPLPPGANAKCPVLVDELVNPAIFTDYNGTRVYFCCQKCRQKFTADPTKYLAVLGITSPSPAAAAPSSEPTTGDSATAPAPTPESPETSALPWATFGRLHPVIIHFPIALLIVAGALSLVPGRRDGRTATFARTCLFLGAAAAVLAAGLGWIHAAHTPEPASLLDTLWWHRWSGTAIAVIALAATAIAFQSGRASATWKSAAASRAAMIASAALVGLTGHFGATLVYGPGYLFDSDADTTAPGIVTNTTNPPALANSPQLRQQPGASSASSYQQNNDTLSSALFSINNEQLLINRRNARLRSIVTPPPPPPSDITGPVLNDIDRFILAEWRAAKLPEATNPPPLCDDAAFARRVYLDLIGVIPTINELRAFLADSAPDKRARLIDSLLARDADYAAHWTPFWEDALGSATTELQGGVPTRGNYREWIERSFRENKPYDVMVTELIDPTMPGHPPETIAEANGRQSRIGYIRNETLKDTLQSAAAVGQVFLGTSMKCASCHGHFENPEWPQKRFVSFAGLFAPNDLDIVRCEAPTGEVAPAAFAFDIPGAPADVPTTLDGRLARAAQLITDPANPRFARSIVNRLWKRYLGLGFVEPVDDFREDRAPSNPELLDWLAYDFMSHGFDLKHTIRLILSSRTYQLAYDPAREDHFDVTNPTAPRHFRSPTLRRLTAEQAIDSIRLAVAQKLEPGRRVYLDKTSTTLTRALGRPASRNEISTLRPDDVAIVQSLELLNGLEFHSLVYDSGRALLNLAPTLDDDALAQAIYLAALSRPPSPDELRLAADFVASARSIASASASATADSSPSEVMWMDDELPDGATPTDGFLWVTAGPDHPVFSGSRSHTQMPGMVQQRSQHYALGADPPFPVGPDDILFAHVYLDPDDPPREFMLQWNDGSWEHRAYWGADEIPYGIADTPSRVPHGPLPATGKWVRLEVHAFDVGLASADPTRGVVGISFDQAGGTVHWDAVGVVHHPSDPLREPIGDLLWALFTSPEFQYIH